MSNNLVVSEGKIKDNLTHPRLAYTTTILRSTMTLSLGTSST